MNSNSPALIVSSLDLERIEDLLESEPHRGSAGATALRAELARASILEPAEMPADVVTMNSTATVIDESTGETRELTLVYPRDADAASNHISIFAPVGAAMLGLRVGDSINWQVPGGRSLKLRIRDISFQPEASGQLHR